jgi:hypothetical protein
MIMIRKHIIEVKIIIAIILIITVHGIINYYRIKIDGYKAEAHCLIFGEDTNYSKDFSHHIFQNIEIGMTEKQVLNLLGQPLFKFSYKWVVGNEMGNKGRFIGFKYSESPSGRDYRLRIIHLDNGIVVRIIGELYLD